MSTEPTLPVTLADIEAAAEVLKPVIARTPVEHSRVLSQHVGAEVFLKCENMQRAGSFKVRGAYVRMSKLSDDEKARGVVAASAGNHAQGVAQAASHLGIKARIYMPRGVALPKLTATRDHGAEVVLFGDTVDEALAEAQRFADESGAVFVHPFDHP
ncbi:MAG: pyridoxal-phosphate dependent enzyme, partial [Glutamicibacter sp.]